jgi:hypothetical protein
MIPDVLLRACLMMLFLSGMFMLLATRTSPRSQSGGWTATWKYLRHLTIRSNPTGRLVIVILTFVTDRVISSCPPTTMSALKQLPKAVKEIRVHLCQTSAASAGVR